MARTLFIALLLSLGGCMLPASVTYLSPEKTSEVSVTSSRRGPDEVVKIKGSTGIEMTLIVFDLDAGTLIRFFFSLPEGHSFQMREDHFRIKTTGPISHQNIGIEKVSINEIRNNVGHQVSFKPLEKIAGATYQIRGDSVPQPVYIEVKTNTRLPEEFDFVLPQLLIDDKPFNASPIHFVRRTGTFLQGSAPW
jgi:hypothetical protein